MAQAQARHTGDTTGRKTGTLHLNKAPKTTRKPRTHRIEKPQDEVQRHDAPPRANESVWVTALSGAEGFHRDALQLELAVGLSVFSVKADAAKVGLDAKKALREIYAKAGYACATPLGEDYKTVLRRINVAADLYVHIGGRETIVDWIGDAAPREQVKTIMEHVKAYGFSGINSVLAYMGKAVATKRPRTEQGSGEGQGPSEAERQVADAAAAALTLRNTVQKLGLPESRIFQHGAMSVAVPNETTYEDIMATIADLSVLAATMRAKAPQAPVTEQAKTPEAALAA